MRDINLKNKVVLKLMTRVRFIDIAKGILMVMVVIHHIPAVANKIGFAFSVDFKYYNLAITPFFMPAFFIITGFCSNFSKPIVQFLKNNIKSIIIPGFFLGIINNWIVLISESCTNPIEYLKLGFRTLLLYGGPYWFLSALFLSKLIYWLINRFINDNTLKIFILLLCVFVGVYMYNEFESYNYWYLFHSLMLVPFLYIGKLVNKVNMNTSYIFLYIAVLCICYYADSIPTVTATVKMSLLQIPIFIYLSFTGTMALMYICNFINNNAILEFFGKNTLIFYGIHISLLFAIFRIVIACDIPITFFTILVIFIICILCCSVASVVLNTRYLRFIIGKFD